MVNKSVFGKSVSKKADKVNLAGGLAYDLGDKHTLAQLAATGMIGNTYYQSAEKELDRVMDLASKVSDEFLAKLAVYSRHSAYMKDMPAVLVAILSTRNSKLTHLVFPKCIDNGKMLRTFFTVVRSGRLGRRGFGSALKRDMQNWFNEAGYSKLVTAKIGNDPSLRDIMRMVRPRPADNTRRALFGYLTDSPVEKWKPARRSDLPESVKNLERFRKTDNIEEQRYLLAEMPFRWDMLVDNLVDESLWVDIAKKMGHQALRMNLNTLQRHGVFNDRKMIDYVAERIASPEEVSKARQFPYQYFAAYMNATDVPAKIRKALHEAAELACGNVPELDKPVIIAVDTSGSMSCPVGGRWGNTNTVMRYVDVAALFGAAMLRVNPDSIILPFDTRAHDMRVDPGDTILSISERISQFVGGGTDCGCAIRHANDKFSNRDLGGIVMISDNESWFNENGGRWGYSTNVVDEWAKFRRHHRGSKMVCIDISPYGDAQAPEDRDVLNMGGFSDAVFNTVAGFMSGDGSRFVKEVEAVTL